MRDVVFAGAPESDREHLRIEDVPRPRVKPRWAPLKVLAREVCRRDLHFLEGGLPAPRPRLISGH